MPANDVTKKQNSLRDISRQNYSPFGKKKEEIQLGAIQRIADATELMAQNYTKIQIERDYYRDLYRGRGAEIIKLNKVILGLKDKILKLKKSK